jgi:hypothetical protein
VAERDDGCPLMGSCGLERALMLHLNRSTTHMLKQHNTSCALSVLLFLWCHCRRMACLLQVAQPAGRSKSRTELHTGDDDSWHSVCILLMGFSKCTLADA